MTSLQEEWTRLADRLGLTVRVEFPIDLDGRNFIAPVLLENFGPRFGMVLVESWDAIADVAEKLVESGFGYSCLGDSNNRELTEDALAGIIDMLRDWIWSGNGDQPAWYVDNAT
jgi:hypothetical protein